MNDYKYTDRQGDELKIARGMLIGDGGIYVHATSDEEHAAVRVEFEDAPAVALAILEAAGLKPTVAPTDETPESWDARAVSYLQQGQQQRKIALAKIAEREAEDAKAKAYRDAVFPNAIKWEHLDEDIREAHRARYRAAREFFEKEGR